MNSNVKKIAAGVTALAMISGMMACGNVNKNATSKDATSVCVTYSNDIEYPVKRGDTLYELAEKHYNNGNYWQELAFYNEITSSKGLIAGTTIRIPRTSKRLLKACGGEIHFIAEGDTLSGICLKYYDDESKETIWKLATYNELRDPNVIIVDGVLRIPSKEDLAKVKSYNYANLGEQILALAKR